MDIPAEARRRAFSAWLRTGRLPSWLKSIPAEFKFNPWHDPDNGRFTFAGTGRYFAHGGGGGAADGLSARHSDERQPAGGSGGGGRSGGGHGGGGGRGHGRKQPFGGFGGGNSPGGGGSGNYEVDPASARPLEPLVSPAIAKRAADENWQRVERNGYIYLIDGRGRTRHVSGGLTTNNAQTRSRSAQSRAGGADRRTTDHGGHYIARRFNGPTEAFNHFAQDANFNRSGYRALEEEWAREMRAGRRVEVDIVPVYEGSSRRPSLINVWFWVDGKRKSVRFPNEPRERTDG